MTPAFIDELGMLSAFVYGRWIHTTIYQLLLIRFLFAPFLKVAASYLLLPNKFSYFFFFVK